MKETVVIIGLGYVGLPLAVEFGKILRTIGFDIRKWRIDELSNDCYDRTMSVTSEELKSAKRLEYTTNKEQLRDATIYIITVPTPIDQYKRPDLSHLYDASATVGKVLSKGDVVVYESTVYPGCTEEECVPVLEKYSGLQFNKDFFCGYSPERVNPGDTKHTVSSIMKITSGSTPEVAKRVDALYKLIIRAGTHCASGIKVAEAAKVIENTQRDLNIALVNELAKIFHRLGIDTTEVLEAAGTKWNFLNFRPGLVGGHCISVDPYYLTHKAKAVGYHPEIILAGRRLNDDMGRYVAWKITKLMIRKGLKINDLNVLVLGVTFKENCPDIRNSRVIDLISELKDVGCNVEVYDPWVDKEKTEQEFKVKIVEKPHFRNQTKYNLVVLAVGHDQFKELDFRALKSNVIIYDVKSFLDKDIVDERL